MNASITILDRLLEQSDSTECQEHVIEQAHYAVDNVHEKFAAKFETLVEEISRVIGQPQYHADLEDPDSAKVPVPKWVSTVKRANAHKLLRVCCWKRDAGLSYLILLIEVDSKDRPNYYDLVLGARKKKQVDPMRMDKIRTADTSFLGWLKQLFNIKSN